MFEQSRRVTLSYGEVAPTDIANLSANDRAQVQLIDVRQPKEWVDELGNIEGSTKLPLADLLLGGPPEGTDPGRPLVIICRSGRRSARASAAMAYLGFTQVYNLTGGMIAWNQAGLDVSRTV
jgi:rhodanese-related sulfurtransferase